MFIQCFMDKTECIDYLQVPTLSALFFCLVLTILSLNNQ